MIKIKPIMSGFITVSKENALTFALDMFNKYHGTFPEKVEFVNARLKGTDLCSLCPLLYITEKKRYIREKSESDIKNTAYKNALVFRNSLNGVVNLYSVVRRYELEIKNAEQFRQNSNNGYAKTYFAYYIKFLTIAMNWHKTKI